MSHITSENSFETAIIQSLLETGGYTEGSASDYSPELGMFKTEILQFLRDSQKKQWDKLSAIHGSDIESRIIQRLYKEMDLRGSLDVIRNGFVDYGVRFKMAFFKPESGLNPDTLALYEQNQLKVIRQVFYSVQTEEFEFEGRIRKKEKIIFPRFHQLNAVRKITNHARNHGVGSNYLIQHSAGSGKSNSIAWLSYRLSGLHNEEDERIFDGVIVVTDRRVLDSQLQNTIYQFEHKSGVVQRIDKDSNQLAEAISGGANIIITTLWGY